MELLNTDLRVIPPFECWGFVLPVLVNFKNSINTRLNNTEPEQMASIGFLSSGSNLFCFLFSSIFYGPRAEVCEGRERSCSVHHSYTPYTVNGVIEIDNLHLFLFAFRWWWMYLSQDPVSLQSMLTYLENYLKLKNKRKTNMMIFGNGRHRPTPYDFFLSHI